LLTFFSTLLEDSLGAIVSASGQDREQDAIRLSWMD